MAASLDESSLKSEIRKILKENELSQITMRIVKEKLVEAFGLDSPKELKPFKQYIKKTTTEFIETIDENSNKMANVVRKNTTKKRKSDGDKNLKTKKKRGEASDSPANRSLKGGKNSKASRDVAQDKKLFNILRNVCRYKGIDTTKEGLGVSKMEKSQANRVMKKALRDIGFECDSSTLSERSVKNLKRKYEVQKELEDIQQMNSRWGVKSASEKLGGSSSSSSVGNQRRSRNRKVVKYTYSDDEDDFEEVLGAHEAKDKDNKSSLMKETAGERKISSSQADDKEETRNTPSSVSPKSSKAEKRAPTSEEPKSETSDNEESESAYEEEDEDSEDYL